MILFGNFARKKAIPKVSGPILPKNMVAVKINFAAEDKSEVIPRLKPTVPSAEAVSKKELYK